MFKIKLEDWPNSFSEEQFLLKSNVAIKAQILMNTMQKVPARSLQLYNSAQSSYSSTDSYITYEEEYANKMYYTEGLNYSNAVHSQPQSQWHDKDWVENETQYISIYEKVFNSFIK